MTNRVPFSARRRCVLALPLLAIVVGSGCSNQQAWLYTSEKESDRAVILDRSLSVPPFRDDRLNENSNLIGLYLIPLMPFGWMDLEAPEGSPMHMTSGLWQWKPNEDLAKAAAEELQAARIFKEAFFTNRRSEGDLILEGTIHSTIYSGTVISYGLSAYGPLLWIVGFPACHTHNGLAVSFALKENPGERVLWENEYSIEESHLSWLYYLHGDFAYSGLYKEIMLQVTADLEAALGRVAVSR